MKKTFFIMMLSLLVMTSSIAFASPVELNGEASYQFRHDTVGNDGNSGVITKFILNGKTALSDKWDVYARFAYEGYTTQPQAADFNTSIYNDKHAASIDQFGVIYKNAGVNYKIGRQSVTLGTGLLYDSQWKIGRGEFADGITATGNIHDYAIKAVAVQEDNVGTNDHKLYAVTVNKPVGKVNLGLVAAKYDDPANVDSSKNYALNAAYKHGKATYYGEYGLSDAVDKNHAYDIGVRYNLTDKDNVFITAYKVEANADIGKRTSFNNNQQGLYYGGWHSFSKDTGLLVEVWNNRDIDTKTKNTSVRTTLHYNF